MEKLYLNHNQLNHVTDVSFIMDSLPKLSLLDLSDNEIRDIPFGALRGYPSLERLYLSNNQIGHISREALELCRSRFSKNCDSDSSAVFSHLSASWKRSWNRKK